MVREPFQVILESQTKKKQTIRYWKLEEEKNSHNNGSPICSPGWYHIIRRKAITTSLSIQIQSSCARQWDEHFYFIYLFPLYSTLFTGFHSEAPFMLLWWISSLSKLTCFVGLSIQVILILQWLSTCRDLQLIFLSELETWSDDKNINFYANRYNDRLKCALYYPPTCNSIHLELMFSIYRNYLLMLCVVAPQERSKKERKKHETTRRSRGEETNRHNRWNL